MASLKKISAVVLYNGKAAGILTKEARTYRFTYDEIYLSDPQNRPVSITLPFQREPYESNTLFPVFVNMLSEGANKRFQCRILRIDENDYFSLLLATVKNDNIGPITVKMIDETT